MYWDDFSVPTCALSLSLYRDVRSTPYVFIHNTSSTGVVFGMEEVQAKLHIHKSHILCINPCVNMYDPHEELYGIADKYVGHRLIHYTELIKHATYNILSDSSFMCLAMHLDIQHNHNYYVARDGRSYDYLYSAAYKPRTPRKEFVPL